MSAELQNPQPEAERKRPFASRVQLALIVLLGLSFVLIAQQFSLDVYYWGVNALILFTLLQIAFGNMPPAFNFRQSMLSLALAAVIITSIVVLSIQLVPVLLQLGR